MLKNCPTFLLLLTYVIVSLISPSTAKRNYEITMDTYNCHSHKPDTVSDLVCKLYHDGKHSIIYAKAKLNENITDFNIQLGFDMLRKDNTKMSVLDVKLNGCKYLTTAYKSNFLQVAQKRLAKVSNMPKKCPLVAGTLFTMNNYTLMEDDFPAVLPQTAWQMSIKFLKGIELYVDIYGQGKIIHKS